MEEDSVRDAHAAYYAAFLASREALLRGIDRKQVLAEIRAEVDNVRPAWDWAITQGRIDEIEQSLAPLARFCRIRGWYGEGEALFSRAVQRLSRTQKERTQSLRGKLLLQQGRFANLLGKRFEANRLQEASLAIFRDLGARRDAAYAVCLLGGCEKLYGSRRHELSLPRTMACPARLYVLRWPGRLPGGEADGAHLPVPGCPRKGPKPSGGH